MNSVWECKIGWAPREKLPMGADFPMRQAIRNAFYQVTGVEAEFIFSGWGAELSESELAVVENREPIR